MTSKKKLFIIINIVLVVLWCGVIFYLSSRTAPQSNAQSRPISGAVVRTIDKIENRNSPENVLKKKIAEFDDKLRDVAHSGCYFVLALLFINLMYLIGKKKFIGVFITVVFCVLYSISDETHQIFVPGRAFQLIDLTNDFLGATAGVIIYLLGVWLIKMKNINDARRFN